MSPRYSEHPLQIFNSLSNELETFEPIEAGKVRLYVCGPTVYDDAHLGHARCYITWDVLVRFLRFLGYEVTYGRNVTDVDDKILNRAKDLGVTPDEVAEKNYQSFKEDMLALNTLLPDKEPRATEYIKEMLLGIESLLASGSAYATSDKSIYFRVASKPDYGKLSKKPLDDLKAGARVEVNEEKESPLDFALWKAVSDDDPNAWDPAEYDLNTEQIGRGRPGWHMECSAMNHGIFGAQIDIHAGGADLVFPHHENEIAQSECWTGQAPFSRYWMHNGFVNVSGEKMSKSLGNFSTIKKVLERYDANTIRYFLLTNGYRMPVDFNDEALGAAKSAIIRIQKELKAGISAFDINDVEAWLKDKESEFEEVYSDFTVLMASDLNTSRALASMNEGLSTFKGYQDALASADKNKIQETTAAFVKALIVFYFLGFDTRPLTEEISADVSDELVVELKTAIENRKTAKAEKNWGEADAIRDEITAQGLKILDNKDGTTSVEKDGVEIVRV